MKTLASQLIMIFCIFSFGWNSEAATQMYKTGTEEAEGYLSMPRKITGNMSAVLIIHDWMGPSEFTQKKADEIAELGYVAFAADIYGKESRPKNIKEAAALAGKYKNDRDELRRRVRAAYDVLRSTKGVDPKKIVVMGYCFGGTAALELARAGAELAGVVSFHGGLSNPNPADAKNIKGKALIMHGALDPFVKAEEVAAFQKEMNDAGVDYQFIFYSGAVHAFAIPGAGNDPKIGAAYNAVADRRSWVEFKNFMKEVTQ
jgi:dienelactone hydrolase